MTHIIGTIAQENQDSLSKDNLNNEQLDQNISESNLIIEENISGKENIVNNIEKTENKLVKVFNTALIGVYFIIVIAFIITLIIIILKSNHKNK